MDLDKLYQRFLAFLWMQTAIISQLFDIVCASLPRLAKVILSNPKILLHPLDLRQQLFMIIWNFMADSVDEGGAESKRALVPTRAYGTVLEIGAGCGHSAKYLDPKRVKAYIALEPNVLLHKDLYLNATLAGFQPSQITILSCGAEETGKILESLRGRQVDTILSILTLCGIPDLKTTLENMVRDVLKPGGTFIFYEHVLSDVHEVKVSQRLWTPLWQFIVGCRLDRHSHYILENLPVEWSERNVGGKKDEDPMNLWWHQQGYLVKAG